MSTNKKKPIKKSHREKPRQSNNSNNNSNRNFGYQSDGDEGTSQISQNFIQSIPQVNLDTLPLFVYHRNSLILKHKIVRTLAFCFYRPEEYAIINYMCSIIEGIYKTEIGKLIALDKYKDQPSSKVQGDMENFLVVRKLEIWERFLDAEKNVTALKQSKMIMEKDGNNDYVKINTNFFNIVTSVCESILKNTSEKEKQFAEDQLVTCKGCRKKRPIYQIQAQFKCDCGSNSIIKKDSSEIRGTMKILNEQINKVLKWKNEMDELKKKQQERQSMERNKNSENHRVTDVDKDILKAIKFIEEESQRIQDYFSPWKKYPLKANGVHMKSAEMEFAPKRNYSKVNELMECKKKRPKVEKIQNFDIIL